jgi:hypothetical protein
MVVIQHQQHLVIAGPGGQRVNYRRHHRLKRGRRRRPEQRGYPLVDARAHPIERGHSMTPEPGRVVVPRVQRQPRNRPVAAPGPLSQEHRLAGPGRGADQHPPPPESLIEPVRQPRPRHEPRTPARHVQLGGQQGIPPRSGTIRSCRPGPVSHGFPPPSPPPARYRVWLQLIVGRPASRAPAPSCAMPARKIPPAMSTFE